MKEILVLVINDEKEDLELEEKILKEALDPKGYSLSLKHLDPLDQDTIEAYLPRAQGLISVYTPFDKKRLESMKNCEIIATQTIGVNGIDLDEATAKGICVSNVPDYCLEEVTLHTLALALGCLRKLRVYDKLARARIWELDDIYSLGSIHRLSDQSFGLLSFGNIARRVAEVLRLFRVKVLAYDPYVDEKVFTEYGVERASSLEELFSSSNILSIHSPLTSETRGLVDGRLLEMMPRGGILINTSRGELIREADLYKALKEGNLSWAGLDVIEDERSFESPLYELENVFLSPHVAYYSEEALLECRIKAASQVGQVLGKSQLPTYLVNKNVMDKTRGKLV